MDISSVKLVIWDLDDTFWRGTLSEGSVEPIQKCIDTVILCAQKGIVSAICSKNDPEPCRDELIKLGVWDYFVFNSINWQPKGQRIKTLISDMNLRPANVLFLDDNRLNLEEARYYCPELMTSLPARIDELFEAAAALDKDDKGLERLNRYKVLEKKRSERQSMGSNEEFLLQSEIKVEIHTDCAAQLERIHELILRSNQLNFTKIRSSKEELETLVQDPDVTSGYVTACDKYGEYGIVGFFAYRNGSAHSTPPHNHTQPDGAPQNTSAHSTLHTPAQPDDTLQSGSHSTPPHTHARGQMIHFLFSCRTLGMGIEQYVYELIGFPEMAVEGDVSARVGEDEPRVTWINRTEVGQNGPKTPFKGSKNGQNGPKTPFKRQKNYQNGLIFNKKSKILIKGPCDLSQIFSFIKNEKIFDCEFTYASEEARSLGVSIEGVNHTMQIVQAKTLTSEQKSQSCSLPFTDSKMYPQSIYDNAYDMVFISILTDVNLGMYKKIGGEQIIAFGEWLYPLTDMANWDKYISGELYTANCKFTRETLEKFAAEYEFIGRMTPEKTVENLKFIRENMAYGAELVIMLGCERAFNQNKREAWVNRHSEHKEFNDALRVFAGDYGNVTLFDVNDYVKSQDDFSDSINHYKKRVYYLMAQKFIEMINARAKTELKQPSRLRLAYLSLRQKIREIITK